MVRTFYLSIAVLLLITASLKAWMLLTDPFVDLKTGHSFHLLAIVVAWELFVACLLLSDLVSPRLSWAITLSTFLLFVCYGVAKLFAGQSHCDCAGYVAIPTWVSLTLNISVVALLIASIPYQDKIRENQILPKQNAVGAVIAIIGLSAWLCIFGFQLNNSSSGSLVAKFDSDIPLRIGVENAITIELVNRSDSREVSH
jgi:hypothetical protein